MNLTNKINKLRPTVLLSEFSLADNSDGQGPYISSWESLETQPTQAELDSVDDSLPTWVEAQNTIEELESQITSRRLREAYTDPTWMNAQEALIATERAKL
jgi:hypothetical protein